MYDPGATNLTSGEHRFRYVSTLQSPVISSEERPSINQRLFQVDEVRTEITYNLTPKAPPKTDLTFNTLGTRESLPPIQSDNQHQFPRDSEPIHPTNFSREG